MKAFRRLSDFRGESRFSTWLTRIAINEGLLRRRSRRPTVSLDDPEVNAEVLMPERPAPWYADPGNRYTQLDLQRIIHEAILQLPDIYRVVFVLRDVEGLSIAETAKALTLQVAAVKSRLLRARLRMRPAVAPLDPGLTLRAVVLLDDDCESHGGRLSLAPRVLRARTRARP